MIRMRMIDCRNATLLTFYKYMYSLDMVLVYILRQRTLE